MKRIFSGFRSVWVSLERAGQAGMCCCLAPALVEELDGVAELVDDVADLFQRVRVVVVFLL